MAKFRISAMVRIDCRLVSSTLVTPRRGLFVLATSVVALGTSHAQMLPREPLGSTSPRRAPTFDQQPGGLARSDDGVRIMNEGNQGIFVSFWNGAGSWENILLPAGQLTNVKCPACGTTISIAYNDGHITQTIAANAGSNFVMSWSDQKNAWDLKPAQ